jgi:hypothetical protein
MSDDKVMKLCDMIRQTSYDIHKYLKSGLLCSSLELSVFP